MNQDETWHASRPRRCPQCARWRPSFLSPKRGHSPQFSTHVYCGQTAGWITMPLGMEVGLSPCHTVLDEDPAPSTQKRRHSPSPIFGPCLLWPNGWWIKMPLGAKVGLGPGRIVLHGDPADPAYPPSPKRDTHPNFRPMSIVAKRSRISATAEHLLRSNHRLTVHIVK